MILSFRRRRSIPSPMMFIADAPNGMEFTIPEGRIEARETERNP